MRKKFLFLSLAVSAVMGLGAVAGVLGSDKDGPRVDATDSISISTAEEFLAAFDGSASKNTTNITLTSDIDLGGVSKGLMMAGDYTGTLDGGGFTISNVTLTKSIFNIVHGSIHDLTLIDTASGSGFGSIAYCLETGGTMTNVKVYETYGAAVNNHGPLAFYSKGTISDCYAHIDTSAYSAANTNFHIARADAGSVFTNDTYTVIGSGTFLTDPTGVAEAANVTAVSVANIETTIGKTATATATLTGSIYNHIKWVVGNTAVATVASVTTTGKTVTVSGVSAGNTTLTAYVYADSAEETLMATSSAATLTVNSATNVSAITVSPSTATIQEGKTQSLTSALTGNIYDHIDWASGDSAIASVVENDSDETKAVVTANAAGETTITAKVYDSDTQLLASGTCAVTVTAATKVDIYFYAQHSKNWSGASVIFYGGTVSGDQTVAMTKLDYTFRFADTSVTGSPVVDWDIFHVLANYSSLNINSSATGVYFQCSNGTAAGRWGSGYSIQGKDQTAGVAITTPDASSGALTNLDSTDAVSTKAALSAAATIQNGGWRVSESICYVVDGSHKTKYDAIMNA